MRILYIDIDSMRADHLGCYGYHRNTSPNIDVLARQGVRFENVYVSDAPCLPSRTALWSGRTGFHTGVVGHGGTAADPFVEGEPREFQSTLGNTSWMAALRQAGYRTATVSPFGERHSAWHWYAGFNEIYNTGQSGLEAADDITTVALDWLGRNAETDDWFLHLNYWDPHTPYRTPAEFGNPFENDPLPEWLTEDVRQQGWDGFGPHSPQEPSGYKNNPDKKPYPRVPDQLDSMDAVKQWIDGYDMGVRYADEHVGRIVAALTDAGILDDTVIIIGADHGENQGELNIWGDHMTADSPTCRVPLIIRWPGLTDQPRVDNALHYHFDWAATLIEMVGGQVPDNWDGESFAGAFKQNDEQGRDSLVTSQCAWSCQRGVWFVEQEQTYLCLRTYHDGYKKLEPVMLFNLTRDPNQQHDLSVERLDLVDKAMSLLTDWQHQMMVTSRTNVDPMMTVLREGGPYHTRGQLPAYLERLRATGRAHHAEWLAAQHPDEI